MLIEEYNEWKYNLLEREKCLDVEIKILKKQLAELHEQGCAIQEPVLTDYVVKYK